MATTTWQCALCGTRNSPGAALCSNCGAPAPGSAVGIQGDASVAVLTSSKPVAPDSPIAATDQTIALPGGLKAYTGTITVAEQDTKKRVSNQSVYGAGGQVIASRNVDSFSRRIGFRIVVQDGTGRPVQVPAQVGIDNSFVFLQQGDVVTLIGRPNADGLLKDPAILNHAGRFTMVPRAWTAIDRTFVTLVILAGLIGFFVTDPTSNFAAERLVHYAAGVLAAWALWARFAEIRRQHNLRSAAQRMVASFGEAWRPRRIVNPSGTIEGAFSFTRGSQSPAEWVSFRLAVAGPHGETTDWIVAAAPQKRLVTDLRMGDQVTLDGDYETGSIQLPHHIKVAMGG